MTIKQNYTGHRKDMETLRDYFYIFKLMGRWPRTLMELGVDNGGSLMLWNDLFELERIVGLDSVLTAKTREMLDRFSHIHFFQFDQRDKGSVYKILKQLESRKWAFDVIVDDCCHDQRAIIMNLKAFWKLLNPGGMYIVEDWRANEKNLHMMLLEEIHEMTDTGVPAMESITILPSMIVFHNEV